MDDVSKFITPTVTAVGIIVGLLIFYLTRKKEYRYKKIDISGEIYGCIYELHHIYFMSSYHKISSFGYFHIIKLGTDKEYFKKFPNPKDHGNVSNEQVNKRFYFASDELDKYNIKSVEIRRSLKKYIGQYRMYLSKEKRKKFDELIKPVNEITAVTYDFSGIETITETEKKMKALTKEYPNDFWEKYNGPIQAIYDFLENNN